MRDKTHTEFVDRWAEFVRNSPDNWRKIYTEFINAQILMNRQFLERLKNTPGGREKIIETYQIKNLQGYEKLLRNDSKKII
jgi:hypothetical protein